MADKGFLIGPGFHQKLKQTIAAVEGRPVGSGGYRLATDLSGDTPGGGAKAIRICTFTGAWAINESKEVTFRGVTATPNTVSAVNLVCGLSPAGECEVSVAKDGTAWYLVQPNLTQLPGYSSGGTQVLTVVGGNLRWIGTTTCATV